MTTLETIFAVALVAGLAVEFITARGLGIRRDQLAREAVALVSAAVDLDDRAVILHRREAFLVERERRLKAWEQAVLQLGAELDKATENSTKFSAALRARAEQLGLSDDT